jgi:hypothetical protein
MLPVALPPEEERPEARQPERRGVPVPRGPRLPQAELERLVDEPEERAASPQREE